METTLPPGLTPGRRLAVGGMAEVFLAQWDDGSGPREVVLKRVLPDVNDEVRELFRREATVLSHVGGGAIVELVTSGPGYLVLEYVDGTDLGRLLTHLSRHGARLPLPAAAHIVRQLLAALAQLHRASDGDRQLGLVHRDINPANLLISQSGAVKLADLGVVKTAMAELPTQGGVKGTLSYMAPEQLRGGAVTPQTDLYGAGLVIWEVLTGSPARPPDSGGLTALVAARQQRPTAPSQMVPGLPASLDGPILRALSPNPAERFDSAAAFAAALEPGLPPSDPIGLGDAVAGMTRSAAPLERTAGPVGSRASSGVDDLVTRANAPSRGAGRRLAWGLALAALAAFAVTVLGQSRRETPSPSPETRPASAPTDGGDPLAGVGAPAVSMPEVPAPALRTAVGAQSRLRQPITTTMLIHGPRDASEAVGQARREPIASLKAPSPRLTVRSSGVPVHVSGAGVRGLAPQTTRPVRRRTHLTLVGTGGAKTQLTLLPSKQGLRARFSGTQALPARCGGRELGVLPSRWFTIRGRTTCTVGSGDARIAVTLDARP